MFRHVAKLPTCVYLRAFSRRGVKRGSDVGDSIRSDSRFFFQTLTFVSHAFLDYRTLVQFHITAYCENTRGQRSIYTCMLHDSAFVNVTVGTESQKFIRTLSMSFSVTSAYASVTSILYHFLAELIDIAMLILLVRISRYDRTNCASLEIMTLKFSTILASSFYEEQLRQRNFQRVIIDTINIIPKLTLYRCVNMEDEASFDILEFSNCLPNEDPLDWFTVERSMCT